MAESYLLFAAALAAGVVEGGSVLSTLVTKRKRPEDYEPPSSTGFAVPSVLYGIISLPMSIIGASPGPAVLSALPFVPRLTEQPNDGDHNESSAMDGSSTMTTNTTTAKMMASNRRLKDASAQGTSEEKSSSSLSQQQQLQQEPQSPTDVRSEMIRRSREENRKALAAAATGRHFRPTPGASQRRTRSVASPSSSSTLNRYFATLDGRPLATPLAEGMRRARILLAGAGIVASLISYQQTKAEEEERCFNRKQELQRQGRDAEALTEYVQQQNRHGVAIRLIPSSNHVEQGAAGRRSVPVLYANTNELRTVSLNKSLPIWNLGWNASEWNQMPLTEDWLIRPGIQEGTHDGDITSSTDLDDEGGKSPSSSRLLVVEANISKPLSAYFAPSKDDPGLENASSLSVESARFMTRVVETVARQKGVLPRPAHTEQRGSQANNNATTASLINVFVGSSETPPPTLVEDPCSNYIYIDGQSTVAAEVALSLERMYHSDLASANDEETWELIETREGTPAEIEASDVNADGASTLVSFVEYVGKKIRQGGELTLLAVTSILTLGGPRQRHERALHVFSDEQNMARWLHGTLSRHGWVVIWHDVSSNDVEAQYADAMSQQGSMAMVCCENDETTCDFVCSVLSSHHVLERETKLLALLEHQTSQSTLNVLAREFATEPSQNLSISTLSVAAIHNKLYEQVQDMLAESRPPSEVQEVIKQRC